VNENILFVDDDPNILQSYQRQFRGRYQVTCAQGAEEGLKTFETAGPFPVVVSDMQMPGINGIQFLVMVRDRSPDTVRMMLTGNANLDTSMTAVNEGHIYRFLVKPCPHEVLTKALEAGIAQYQLATAEKELLSKTLRGSIRVMADVLALTNPLAFGRSSRVQRLVRSLATELNAPAAWMYEIAALLSQLGCVAVPERTLDKVFRNAKLSEDELQIYEGHPAVARELIANIPRLEEVAQIIGCQNHRFDRADLPADEPSGELLPLGARILKVALDFDALVSRQPSEKLALAEILGRDGWYDPAVVTALKHVLDLDLRTAIKSVSLEQLDDNAILAEDVRSLSGTLLIARGQEVTPSLRIALDRHAKIVGIREPIRIVVWLGLPAGVAERPVLQAVP
jgi:response regulator RpfG family c-di-GMP phosphodiesterase